jgi:hypothetical protein
LAVLTSTDPILVGLIPWCRYPVVKEGVVLGRVVDCFLVSNPRNSYLGNLIYYWRCNLKVIQYLVTVRLVLSKHGDYKALHGVKEDAPADAGASSFILELHAR